MSTITTPVAFTDASQDCRDLRGAFKGMSCDKETVIKILAHRDYLERRGIREKYRSMYGEDLLDRLKSELHGKLEKAVVLWMHDDPDRDSIIVRDTLTGWSTKDRVLIEIFCSRTSSQLDEIKQAYNHRYGRSLEEDIASDTSGDFKKLLLSYLGPHRPESTKVDMHLAQSDAKSLFKAGEGRVGTDEAAIIELLSTRSAEQLNAAFDVYKLEYGRDIEKAMEHESSGEFQQALRATIKCIHNPTKYFAEALYKSMKGLGTDDPTLIRIVVTRAEMDLKYIKDEFVREYKKSLEHMISSDTVGKYKIFLLALIGARNY